MYAPTQEYKKPVASSERLAMVGDRVRCWDKEHYRRHGPIGVTGTVDSRRYSAEFHFWSFTIVCDDGKIVHLCQGALWGFELADERK